MCGIAGKLVFDRPILESDLTTVKKIRDSMIHRGPDGYGLLEIDNLILAHRRLSIIDLSDNAKQPMSSIDGRYHITYNGEIYNFLEIRKELIKKGYSFQSNSDTEVLLNAYIEYGEHCLNIFNGMFAFAIWDTKERTLFMSRDRFGKKPLYYQKNKDSFTFSSEIKGLRQDSSINFNLSLEALNCYLALGYILNPMTMYEDIFCLEPASFMKIDENGKTIEKDYYWNYADCFRDKHNDKESDIQQNILNLLQAATKRRMISDVPVGAFLSGGIDSSSIVAMMKKLGKEQLHTFSVGFKHNSYNELPDADKVGELLNTIHHGLIVDKKNAIDEFLKEIVFASDQLFADNSIIPMIEVSKLASEKVTVVLSGDGADELFAGYVTYSADLLYKKALMLPYILRKLIGSEKLNLVPFSKQKLNFDYRRKQFFRGTLHNYQKAHYMWRQIFNEQERIQILGIHNKEMVIETDPFRRFNEYYESVSDLEELDQHLYVDAMTWLTDDILPKVDRSTMNASIEARAPYLDIDLVKYVAGIKPEIKFDKGEKKAILKKTLKGTLPEFVLKKKKSGFNAPVFDWINSDESNEFKGYTKYIFNKY